MSAARKLFIAEEADPPIGLLLRNGRHPLGSISEADFIVYPHLLRGEKQIRGTLAKISRQYFSQAKRVLVFLLSDHEGEYPFHSNLILLRTSAQADKLASNEYILPYLWECKDEPFTAVSSPGLPSVGFCGLLSKPRRKLMAEFENSASIKCNFIKRDSFWGGKPHDAGLKSAFWNNLQQNQFALAPRGAGNFSMRFYQALSVGRIPVLTDTNMALPLGALIPWKKFIVFEKTEAQCLRRVLEIHATGQVVALQQMCHQIFQDYLSPRTFLGRLLHQLTDTDGPGPSIVLKA